MDIDNFIQRSGSGAHSRRFGSLMDIDNFIPLFYDFQGGAVLLREIPTLREGPGCGLMLAAIILARLPRRRKK